jgi:hypothetical protein
VAEIGILRDSQALPVSHPLSEFFAGGREFRSSGRSRGLARPLS